MKAGRITNIYIGRNKFCRSSLPQGGDWKEAYNVCKGGNKSVKQETAHHTTEKKGVGKLDKRNVI